MPRPLPRPVTFLAIAIAAALLPLVGTGSATAGPARSTAASSAPVSAVPSGWVPRPEQYPNTVMQKDLAIPMSDGVVLRGDVTLPADADGKAIAGRFPVIVTITAYNKTVVNSTGLGGPDPAYLVKRGYVQLTVDARGTGSSEGSWGAFSARENKDAGEVIEWAHAKARPWSNGKIGMSGPSYMGISQLFAAEHQPAGLKAIFPQVPAADVYRDVVASGGQIDVGFMPFWLGIVTVTGLIPPAYVSSDPASAIGVLLTHLMAGGTFSGALMLQAVLGQNPAYDGPFYRERSPITQIDKVKVPTFFVSGEYDLFQRGTPLNFEALQKNGVPTKLIIGPWDHLQASSGEHMSDAGYGTLEELWLRWFDKYVRGVSDPALDSDIASLTYYEQGTGKWRTADKWIGGRLSAKSLRLSGSSSTGGAAGSLTTGAVKSGRSDVLPIPVAGLCTRSTSQWTAGIVNLIAPDNPCITNSSWNDKLGVVYETPALSKALAIQGPINARLYVSSIGGDGMLSVAVSDVAPDGTVTRLTGGWQVISHRALIKSKSRYLDGKLIQPWHPFTKATQQKLGSGEVAPVDVEIFPTGAKILPGHKLRLSIQAFDVPHLLPTLPDLLGALTVVRVHNSAEYPSVLTLPAVR